MPEILSIGELLDLGNDNNSAYIPYSGLEYNASGAISGISGSAIAGGVESSVVSSIVSSMVSGKADQSAVNECCSSMSAEVSSKLDATASSLFQPSGNYQPSGSYVAESSYSSFTSNVTSDISSISSTVSGLTGDYLEKSASSMFAPSGEYAYESSLSYYLPNSASSNFAPSGSYAYSSSLSAYAYESSVSAWTAKQDALTFGYTGSSISSINGSAIDGGGEQVQSNWAENDPTVVSYIQNKPTIPSSMKILSAGNCLSLTDGPVSVTMDWVTTVGITDIQQVSALPVDPVSTVLYIIPEP